MSTAMSSVTLHIDTVRECAIAPFGGQISVTSRASDCRFGGSREPSNLCRGLLGTDAGYANHSRRSRAISATARTRRHQGWLATGLLKKFG